jgi:hypothetical protein
MSLEGRDPTPPCLAAAPDRFVAGAFKRNDGCSCLISQGEVLGIEQQEVVPGVGQDRHVEVRSPGGPDDGSTGLDGVFDRVHLASMPATAALAPVRPTDGDGRVSAALSHIVSTPLDITQRAKTVVSEVEEPFGVVQRFPSPGAPGGGIGCSRGSVIPRIWRGPPVLSKVPEQSRAGAERGRISSKFVRYVAGGNGGPRLRREHRTLNVMICHSLPADFRRRCAVRAQASGDRRTCPARGSWDTLPCRGGGSALGGPSCPGSPPCSLPQEGARPPSEPSLTTRGLWFVSH